MPTKRLVTPCGHGGQRLRQAPRGASRQAQRTAELPPVSHDRGCRKYHQAHSVEESGLSHVSFSLWTSGQHARTRLSRPGQPHSSRSPVDSFFHGYGVPDGACGLTPPPRASFFEGTKPPFKYVVWIFCFFKPTALELWGTQWPTRRRATADAPLSRTCSGIQRLQRTTHTSTHYAAPSFFLLLVLRQVCIAVSNIELILFNDAWGTLHSNSVKNGCRGRPW